MHETAMDEARKFYRKYATNRGKLRIADVGSKDVNGTMRPIFDGHDYVGFDIEAGNNVDVVLTDPNVVNAADGSFDMVISANCLEHVRRPWVMVREMARILKPGGMMFVLMPCKHPYHAYPIDCWRAYAEGVRGLLEDAGLRVLDVHDDNGHDAVGIARKIA